MKRMIDNKKLKEIEASGGTQWYSHKLHNRRREYIEFVLPFEKNLLEIANPPIFKNVFGIVLQVNGSSFSNINETSTFANLRFDSMQIKFSSVKSDGSIVNTTININEYTEDIVNKYQVF